MNSNYVKIWLICEILYVFNNVIAVGVVNLCLTLYASKDIEVLERSKKTIEERSMSENPQIERVRSSTYDRDIFRLSEPENDRNNANISRSTRKDSETEDEGEQLDLVWAKLQICNILTIR